MNHAYPLIAEHGLIGDLQTAALVSTSGSIDWFCSPRFDGPSIFGSLLDRTRGGHFTVRPAQDDFDVRQLYLPDTAILVTRFLTPAGVGELIDFMPPEPQPATDRHRIVRALRCVRGELTFDIELAPRFDYGRVPHTARITDHGAVFTSADSAMAVTVHAVREPDDERLALARTTEAGDLHLTAHLRAGQVRGLVLETVADEPREVRPIEVLSLLDQGRRFWQSWLARSTYDGRWREIVDRSAITLKLLTYAPTGGIVAAPTAGLPEQVGGERNWDYRFTWIRDASFSVHALLRLGFTQEAAAFSTWVRERLRGPASDAGSPLNIMYRVDGSTDLGEEILGHWEGYQGSRPVRIGNGAADQLQLDIFGEAIDSIWRADQAGLRIGYDGWLALSAAVNWLADNWDQPEEGIWETRGGPKNFTYGRLMSWVAFDRAVRLARKHARPAPVGVWARERDTIYEQIHQRGWKRERGAFVQHYDDRVLDASLLRMAGTGFIAPRDPRWLATLRAMEGELVSDSLVYRYDPEASPDGLRGNEGTFSLCTFGYVDALARAGRLGDARLVFEKMLTYANHVGLFSEEIGLTGEQLGNFPQAFTHLALIDAALTLDDALTRTHAHRAARARADADGPAQERRSPWPGHWW